MLVYILIFVIHALRPSFMLYHLILKKSNTMDVTIRTGTGYTSGQPRCLLGFLLLHLLFSVCVVIVDHCLSCHTFSLVHCIVCPLVNGF